MLTTVLLLDVHVLLGAHRADHPDHACIRALCDYLLAGDDRRIRER